MKCRKMMLGMSVGISVLLFTSSFSLAMEPGKLLMETVDKGPQFSKNLPVRNGKDTGTQASVMERDFNRFNFEEMLKGRWVSTGRNVRLRKKEFVELFTNILKDAYIGKTDTYNGEKSFF